MDAFDIDQLDMGNAPPVVARHGGAQDRVFPLGGARTHTCVCLENMFVGNWCDPAKA